MAYDMKEIFGEMFIAYINMIGNPQSEYRKEHASKLRAALENLRALGTTFDELASDKAYQELVMATDTGMARFKDFVHEFTISGYDDSADMSDIVDEQMEIARWVKEHRKELIS